MLFESSTNPTVKIAIPPKINADLKVTSIGKSMSVDKNATKNESPPTLAVGILCDFLLFGISNAPNTLAKAIEGENNIYEMINAQSPKEILIKNIKTPLIYVSKGYNYVILN